MRGAVTRATHVVALSAVILMGGCDLEEVTIVEPESVLVVEAFLLLGDLETIGRVFLYSSLGAGPNDDLPVAEIVLSSESGGIFEFTEAHALVCLSLAPEVEAYGRCYVGQEAGAPLFRPGDRVTLEVRTSSGQVLQGSSTIPGDFTFDGNASQIGCRLPADTAFELSWSRSEGVVGYLGETWLRGLPEALAERGLVVTDDPLILRGLSVSADDTSIRFPSDFGIFERLALDADLARALQVGMPPDTWADVVVSAADLNLVNWLRPGDFNPSGLIRVPSLFGDGTGVFGTAMARRVQIAVEVPSLFYLDECAG